MQALASTLDGRALGLVDLDVKPAVVPVRDITDVPVIALLEALLEPAGAVAALNAAGVPAWATVGELDALAEGRLREAVAQELVGS